ncbi:MAG: nucleoside-triphosphatase [Desulfomonilaceae bacterium]
MTATNLLITGPPRCGKSTLIESVVSRIDRPLTGFFTREIREKGRRTGFMIVTLEGREGVLAHEKIKSPVRVGKYGVNLEDLDRIAVPAMVPSEQGQIVVIDEIGKMECFSSLFRETLVQALDSSHKVLGSIALKGGQFIQRIKSRVDVKLFYVSEENRDALATSSVDILLCEGISWDS